MFFVEIAARLYSKLNYVSRKINPQVSILFFLDKTKKNNNEKQKSDKIFWAFIDKKNILTLGKKRLFFVEIAGLYWLKNSFFHERSKQGLCRKTKIAVIVEFIEILSSTKKNMHFLWKFEGKLKFKNLSKTNYNSFSGFCF